jgi:hypothetical protein
MSKRPQEMPIDYMVVECSSEEGGHPASNLESADSLGWLSQPGCIYPLSLLVHLRERFEVSSVTLLPHQLYASKKIELYIGDVEGAFELSDNYDASRADAEMLCREATFRRLGHLAFASNEDNGFTVREQKTVRIKVAGSMVKIVFHEPHNIPGNNHRQVALINLLITGTPIASPSSKSATPELDAKKETNDPGDPSAYFLGTGMSGPPACLCPPARLPAVLPFCL